MTTISVISAESVSPFNIMTEILLSGGQSTYPADQSGVQFENGSLSTVSIFRDGALAYKVMVNPNLTQSDFDYAAQGPGQLEEVIQQQAPYTMDATATSEHVRFEDSEYSDTVLAGPGGSYIVIGPASENDLFQGNTEFDVIDFSFDLAPSILDLTAQDGRISGSFEQIIGSDYDDRLIGDDGNQNMDGGRGSDTMDGGGGVDTLEFTSLAHGVQVDLAAGHAFTITGTDNDQDTISNFENVTGTSLRDIITGTSDANILKGGDGDDELHGYAGDDTLLGGTGNDWIESWEGNDYIDGGDGIDTLAVWSVTHPVEVYLNHGVTRIGADRDTVLNIENIVGTEAGDRLIGNDAANTIEGSGGNDLLKGFDGNDRLEGGEGEDRTSGGNGNDVIMGDTGNDYLNGGRDHDELYGGDGNDKLVGGHGSDDLFGWIGNDVLLGGTGNDALNGDAGNDYLWGENGLDTLNGGTGNDVMKGGGGADMFVFSTAFDGGGYDRVVDFENGLDQIDLRGTGLTDFTTDILSLTTEMSYGLRLKFGPGDTLYLIGMSLDDFDTSDLILA